MVEGPLWHCEATLHSGSYGRDLLLDMWNAAWGGVLPCKDVICQDIWNGVTVGWHFWCSCYLRGVPQTQWSYAEVGNCYFFIY